MTDTGPIRRRRYVPIPTTPDSPADLPQPSEQPKTAPVDPSPRVPVPAR